MQERPGIEQFPKLTQAQVDETARKHQLLQAGRLGGARADFSFCDLSGLTLAGRNFTDAIFTGAVMVESDLSSARLDCAQFVGCDMRRANLANASLKRSDLRGACLRGAILQGANLFDADLREALIAQRDEKGNLKAWSHRSSPTDMSGANASKANLERARMNNLVATQADFSDAVMRG